MRDYRYILKGHTPVLEPDLKKWATWFEGIKNRVVRQEHVGTIFVSTVFLCIDHNFGDSDKPVLFETMAFKDDKEVRGQTKRYCTWEDAVKGHEKTVKDLQKEVQ